MNKFANKSSNATTRLPRTQQRRKSTAPLWNIKGERSVLQAREGELAYMDISVDDSIVYLAALEPEQF